MFYQLLEEQTSHSYTLVEDVKVTPELAKIIANLWRDKGLQAAFRYNLFWVMHPTTCLGVLSKRENLFLCPKYYTRTFRQLQYDFNKIPWEINPWHGGDLGLVIVPWNFFILYLLGNKNVTLFSVIKMKKPPCFSSCLLYSKKPFNLFLVGFQVPSSTTTYIQDI